MTAINSVRAYSVEVVVREKATGKTRTETRTEQAYRIEDVLLQVAVAVASNGQDEFVTILRIGPTTEALDRSDALHSQLEQALAKIRR